MGGSIITHNVGEDADLGGATVLSNQQPKGGKKGRRGDMNQG